MARSEALDVPEDVRLLVLERDSWTCRVCGRWLGDRAGIHHILFGGGQGPGIGGRRVHDPAAMVTICWLGGRSCHELVHGAKLEWQPFLLEVVQRPGVTALALRRWSLRRARQREARDDQRQAEDRQGEALVEVTAPDAAARTITDSACMG